MIAKGMGRRRHRRRGMSVQGILVTVGVVLAILGAAWFAVTLWQRTRALPEVARIVSRVSAEARRISADSRTAFTLDLPEVMSALRHENLDMQDGRISLPLGGAIHWIARDPVPGSRNFSLLAGWERGGANAGVLCTYLATAGSEDARGWRSGPAGTGYRVTRASCDGPGAAYVELAYRPG